jgi:hypothetical protein
VTARQQGGEHEAELRPLADDGALDLVEDAVGGGCCALDQRRRRR